MDKKPLRLSVYFNNSPIFSPAKDPGVLEKNPLAKNILGIAGTMALTLGEALKGKVFTVVKAEVANNELYCTATTEDALDAKTITLCCSATELPAKGPLDPIGQGDRIVKGAEGRDSSALQAKKAQSMYTQALGGLDVPSLLEMQAATFCSDRVLVGIAKAIKKKTHAPEDLEGLVKERRQKVLDYIDGVMV